MRQAAYSARPSMRSDRMKVCKRQNGRQNPNVRLIGSGCQRRLKHQILHHPAPRCASHKGNMRQSSWIHRARLSHATYPVPFPGRSLSEAFLSLSHTSELRRPDKQRQVQIAPPSHRHRYSSPQPCSISPPCLFYNHIPAPGRSTVPHTTPTHGTDAYTLLATILERSSTLPFAPPALFVSPDSECVWVNVCNLLYCQGQCAA